MVLLRAFLIAFVALGLVYLVLRIALGLQERARLGREWDQGNLGGDRAAYVRAGLARYHHSLRRKLLWGVIVVPLAGFALLLYLLNVS